MKLPFDYRLFDLEPRDLMVYEAMLTNPDAHSIRTIAAQVNMNRGTTFEIIKKLVTVGLAAGYFKNSRKYYRAEPPESLKKYASQRQRSITDEVSRVEQYVEHLEAVQPQSPAQQFSKYYEGEEEIAALLQDVLETVSGLPDKTYRAVSSAEVRNHLYGKFRNYTRQRIKHGIHVQVIGVGGEDAIADLAERTVLSPDEIPASYIIIYGDKVAQITLTSLGDIQGAVVDNPGVAQLQRLLFDKLWERL